MNRQDPFEFERDREAARRGYGRTDTPGGQLGDSERVRDRWVQQMSQPVQTIWPIHEETPANPPQTQSSGGGGFGVFVMIVIGLVLLGSQSKHETPEPPPSMNSAGPSTPSRPPVIQPASPSGAGTMLADSIPPVPADAGPALSTAPPVPIKPALVSPITLEAFADNNLVLAPGEFVELRLRWHGTEAQSRRVPVTGRIVALDQPGQPSDFVMESATDDSRFAFRLGEDFVPGSYMAVLQWLIPGQPPTEGRVRFTVISPTTPAQEPAAMPAMPAMREAPFHKPLSDSDSG